MSADMNRDKSEQEWAEEAYAHRRDPALWEDAGEPVNAPTAPRTTVISCRLPIDDFNALMQTARAAGETLSEFVRKAVEMRVGVRTPISSIATGIATEPDDERAARSSSGSVEQGESAAPYSKTLPAQLVPVT